MILFLNVEIFVVDRMRWALDLNVAARFESDVFAFGQFENQLLDERRNVVVGANSTFPFFCFKRFVGYFDLHVTFYSDLTRQSATFTRLAFVDVSLFGVQKIAATLGDFDDTLGARSTAAAGRGHKDPLVG